MQLSNGDTNTLVGSRRITASRSFQWVRHNLEWYASELEIDILIERSVISKGRTPMRVRVPDDPPITKQSRTPNWKEYLSCRAKVCHANPYVFGRVAMATIMKVLTWFMLICTCNAFINTNAKPSFYQHKPTASTNFRKMTTELKSKPFGVIVDAEIKEDRMEEFLKLIQTNAENSRKEPGCIRFGKSNTTHEIRKKSQTVFSMLHPGSRCRASNPSRSIVAS